MTATGLDLDMLASDIADVLSRYGYPLDVAADDIRPALPAFVEQITVHAANDDGWENAGDAAAWTPNLDAPTDPTPQTGCAPRMTYLPWHTDQGVDMGATARTEHYWRCPVCHTWVGPYQDPMAAKTTGMDHRYCEHDLPAARRTEARKSARKVAGSHVTAAVFDQIVGRLADTYALPAPAVHQIVHRVASTIQGYGSARDLVFHIDHDQITSATHSTRDIVDDIAGQLGYHGWLTRMGA